MPARRTEKYREGVVELAREAVLDVPSIALLALRKPSDMVADFTAAWGMKPKAAVIPMISPDGVNFDNPCALPLSRWAKPMTTDPNDTDSNHRASFAQAVFQFAELGCDIYLSVDPAMSFVSDNPSLIVDCVGDISRQTCIAKNHNRDTLSEVVTEGVILAIESLENIPKESQVRLRGIVFELVDVWPMGATDGRIELTCFCEECIPQLESYMKETYEPPDVLGAFRDFPSPANLLLADDTTAIKYEDRVISTMSPAKVVALCKMKGFQDIWKGKEEKDLTDAAAYLISYLKARHRMTVGAVQSTFQSVQGKLEEEGMSEVAPKLELIFLTEGEAYNWTSGLFLDWIDDWAGDFEKPPCDEIWYNPTSVTPIVTNIRTRAYMWRRSRYGIDSFFKSLASVSDKSIRSITGWARFGDVEVVQLLHSRKRSALAGRTEGLVSIKALGEQSNRVGFVGVALNEATVDLLIKETPIETGRGTGPA